MMIDFFLERFAANRALPAIVWRDQTFDYAWLLGQVRLWQDRLKAESVATGAVTILEADFSPSSIALFLALAGHGCILVPLTSAVGPRASDFIEIAQGEIRFVTDDADRVAVHRTGRSADHALYARLRHAGRPGLVLFSSGSTGQRKAIVHDLALVLEKFSTPRPAQRAIPFLLFDHIGGVNTMLHLLANAGCLVTVPDRSPDAVLAAVEKHRVELLPTSPTFLNLVLLSEAWRRHDLRSLRTVTYGTEPMPESTLRRFHELFPWIKLLQTYGLSEVGILRSQSKSSDSLWVRVGGEGFQTRVVDGVLQVKARSAMLGYLNAPSPFTADGWLNTGDLVEVDGDFIRFLGRQSEVINLGGQKVHPAEVESVLLELSGVEEAAVAGEPNPITGQIVVARVKLNTGETAATFRRRLWDHCQGRLPSYKIPQKVVLVAASFAGARFKKMRGEPKP
jgi:acyl-coenzyme A synthetase/AMP-(fatty) acid ligase